jgi:alpha-tubulin suppressor-like RCC1 family protein
LLVLGLAACGRIGFGDVSSAIGDGGGSGDGAVPGDGMAAHPFTSIVAYANQTCGIIGMRAYCWGQNDSNQIANQNGDVAQPLEVALPSGIVRAISQGESHACAILGDKLFCWGSGFGADPVRIDLGSSPQQIGCGRDFTCALAAGVVQCFGNDDTGQLGDGMMTGRASPMPIAFTGTATAISVGDDHACASVVSAAPICWGHNDNGTLGTGSFTPVSSATPVTVVASFDAVPRIAGWHACALTGNDVLCWGRNVEGELGNPGGDAATPTVVPNLGAATSIGVGGGPTDFDATCAVVDGFVSCWGRGLGGRLGNGSTDDSAKPVMVKGLPAKAGSVAIGYDHACALLLSGDIYCWGAGDHGQLGDGLQTSSLVPVKVVSPL